MKQIICSSILAFKKECKRWSMPQYMRMMESFPLAELNFIDGGQSHSQFYATLGFAYLQIQCQQDQKRTYEDCIVLIQEFKDQHLMNEHCIFQSISDIDECLKIIENLLINDLSLEKLDYKNLYLFSNTIFRILLIQYFSDCVKQYGLENNIQDFLNLMILQIEKNKANFMKDFEMLQYFSRFLKFITGGPVKLVLITDQYCDQTASLGSYNMFFYFNQENNQLYHLVQDSQTMKKFIECNQQKINDRLKKNKEMEQVIITLNDSLQSVIENIKQPNVEDDFQIILSESDNQRIKYHIKQNIKQIQDLHLSLEPQIMNIMQNLLKLMNE